VLHRRGQWRGGKACQIATKRRLAAIAWRTHCVSPGRRLVNRRVFSAKRKSAASAPTPFAREAKQLDQEQPVARTGVNMMHTDE
jgi:hypothetical protein